MLAACLRSLVLGLLAFASGCAMCGGCDDYTYGAYGGRWDRLDQCYGRVGSVFTPEVGMRVDSDHGAGEPVPAQPRPSTTPPSAEGITPQPMPTEGSPADRMPPESAPEAMPFEDAAPTPPPTTTPGTKPDTSVLRQPPRTLR